MAKNRRKKLLIEPKFQIGFLIHSLSGALISAAIFYGANRYFFWRFSEYGHKAGLAQDHIFFRFLQVQQSHMDRIFLGTVLFLCCALLFHGLVYSNKIAGPIYRLKKTLASFAEGKPVGAMHFRKGDLFTELEPLVNDSLELKKSQKSRKAG